MTTCYEIEDILNLLSKIYDGFPAKDMKDLILISVCYEFEPHGRACEDWEIVYRLSIPYIFSYWKGREGWVKRENKDLYWKCKGRTLQKCLDETYDLLSTTNISKRAENL